MVAIALSLIQLERLDQRKKYLNAIQKHTITHGLCLFHKTYEITSILISHLILAFPNNFQYQPWEFAIRMVDIHDVTDV